jgi:hypothetical protein
MVKFILLLICIVTLPFELVRMTLYAQITLFKKWWICVITIMNPSNQTNEHDESRNA